MILGMISPTVPSLTEALVENLLRDRHNQKEKLLIQSCCVFR